MLAMVRLAIKRGELRLSQEIVTLVVLTLDLLVGHVGQKCLRLLLLEVRQLVLHVVDPVVDRVVRTDRPVCWNLWHF